LRGGIVYTDARSISKCDIFVRKLNEQLIAENPLIFGARQNFRCQDFLNNFILIISKMSYVKEEILFVIDNCEEIIEKDRQDFKVLVSLMLAKIPSIKVLLTTRIRLGMVKEANEEIIVLNGLTSLNSEVLLKQKLNRKIAVSEENRLMKVLPDFEKYPD